MATEDINIVRPIEIKSDATARVAFDLMDHISRREKVGEAEAKSRDYWLTLYFQCLKAARGDALKHILELK